MSEAAALVRVEAGLFEEIVRRREALPVARAASAEEAELIAERLAALGLRAEVVWDEVLAVEAEPPRRVRRLEMGGAGVRGWDASGASEFFAWKDVDFMAVGRIVTRRVETEERRGRVRSGDEVADAREVFSDDAALELYAAGSRAGWRIMAGGFDYSCLGAEMGLLATENFKSLVWALRARAADAVYDNGYERARTLLAAAWPPVERTEAGGLRRERPGKFNTEAVTVVSNDAQFTRYARLRRLFAAHTQGAE